MDGWKRSWKSKFPEHLSLGKKGLFMIGFEEIMGER